MAKGEGLGGTRGKGLRVANVEALREGQGLWVGERLMVGKRALIKGGKRVGKGEG